MEFECKGDWDKLKQILEEAPKESEYITYKGEKWIKEDFVIPISVIKNKIDEMNKIINSSENRHHIHTKIEASIVKGELQELLEERNK